MESYVFAFAVPAVAMILDSLFGDPHNLPHPVRFIGQGLDLFETIARKVTLDLRIAGWAAVVLFVVGTWSVAELLMAIPYLGILIAIYLAYDSMAVQYKRAGRNVPPARYVQFSKQDRKSALRTG